MNKAFKKVLSVVLSLAMVLTSITIYNTTAKADVIDVTVTATQRDGYAGIDASWATPDVEFSTLGIYLNKSGEDAFDEAHYATASNGHCWSKISNTAKNTTVDTVIRTDDSSLKITDGGDYVIVVRYYDADGNVVAQGTSNVITYAEYVNENTTLNLTVVDKEKGAITNDGPRFNWDLVAGAVTYKIDALKADGTIARTWSEGSQVKTKYYWGSDVTVEAVGAATYTLRVQALDSTGAVITEESIEDVPAYNPVNTNATLGVTYGTGTAILTWTAITNAASYKVTVGDIVKDVTTTNVTVDVEANVEYNATVQAFDAEGQEITLTNNTATVKYVPEAAPADNDISKVDTSSWTKLAVKKGTVESEYYINSAHGLSTATWYGIYAPHSDADYHNRAEACNIPAGVAAFEFKDSNITAIWVNQVKYEKGSTAFSMRNDQAEISAEVLPVGENVITLVRSDNSMTTFAIKVKGEEAPDTSGVDVSAWTDIPVAGTDAASVVNTYAINTAGYTEHVNAAIFGMYSPASSTAYHGGDCHIEGAAFGFAIKNNGNVTAIWVDGTKYLPGTVYIHTRNDSIEIAESLLAEEGIHYVSVVGNATSSFAIKTVAPQAETAPDQTLDEVTDWVMVGSEEKADYVSENGNSFYVSQAFRDANINYVDLFGLYTDHTATPYHPEGCTVTSAVYVSSYPSIANTIKSVWVDGVKYESGTELCYIAGDQVHLAQSIFSTKKTYAVTVRANSGDYTYAVKVEEAPQATTYAVSIDGVEVEQVEEGKTYTLPTDATYGYFCDGKMYKAGAEVTVTAAMAFTSVNELSVTMANGAGIRYIGSAGIRFQSTIATDNWDAVKSDAITEGTLITAQDIYEAKGQPLTLTSDYTKLNVVNEGWFKNNVGTYCGSICNVIESNYIRHFTARAYVTINYVGGEAVTIYSNMGPDRTISGVAAAVKAAGYPSIAEAYHSVIDSFIKE